MKESSVITHVPLFASLPQSEVEYLLSNLHRRNVSADTVLFREGDHGDRFFIILEGRLDIVKALDTPEERLLSTCGPGDYLGEMCLLDPEGVRTASVRTRSGVTLLEMTRPDFYALLHRRPAVAYEMARTLSMHLRKSDNATIRDLQEKNKQLAKAYQDLKAAQAQIIEKEKLERELQLARQIQQSILPCSLPSFAGFDFGARMVPARAVGGDLFDFIPLDEGHLGIAVGDVSGKGVPAAIFMAMTRSLMRAEARRVRSPFEALQGVNRHLLEMNDAGMFVTLLYGVLDRATRTFDYVRAGHEPPLLCKSEGEVIKPRVAEGMALGIFPNPPLDEQSVVLPPGCALLIYTDGVTEAVNGKGAFFGVGRLHEQVRTHCHTSAQSICDRLIEAVLSYQGDLPQHDDVTLVAVRGSELGECRMS